MSLKIDAKQFDDQLAGLESRIMTAVEMYADTKGQQMQAYAKENRPWVDRTGDAKKRIRYSISNPTKNTVRITLAHGVEYGIWLELAHERRYGIVVPTVEKFGPEVMKGFKGLLNKIKGQ